MRTLDELIDELNHDPEFRRAYRRLWLRHALGRKWLRLRVRLLRLL
jgi:hypothetical protein